MARDNNGTIEDWVTRKQLSAEGTTVAVRVCTKARKQSLNLTAGNATVLIREGQSLLSYSHYDAVVEIKAAERPIHSFVLASISPIDPAVSIGVSGKVLFIGSYQTLYAIALLSCELLFQIELPEGPEVSDLRTLTVGNEAAAVVVSETAIRLVLENGIVRWIAEFEDPVKLIRLTDDEAVCETLVPDGAGNFWSARIDLATGESAFIK